MSTSLHSLMDGLPLTQLRGGDATVSQLATDSRQVRPGTLFMAREGWFVDSHRFLQDAIDAGASALVVTRADAVPQACPVPVWLSRQEDRDLGLMADRFFGEPTTGLRVIGVTGTNGKTSVTWTVAHMLRSLGERPAVMGTVSYQFEDRTIVARNTTPDGLTIHRFAREVADAGATALVMEMSSHGIALDRIAGVVFDTVAFTNLTRDHLDFHKTFEEYRAAKRRLFTDVLDASIARGAQCRAVAIVDDAEGRAMLDATPDAVKNVPVSLRDDGPEDALKVTVAARNGIDATTIVHDGRPVTLPLFGDHNVANTALAAAIVACDDRADVDAALATMHSFPGVPGRAERVCATLDGEPGIIVDYAHSDDAVERIVGAVVDAGASPVVVLGCGGDRDATKRRPMADAALTHAARCVFTSDNPRSEAPRDILDDMVRGLDNDALGRVDIVVDRSDAIARAVEVAGDRPVLILGKGHETYQELGGRRYHLDDREEARRALVGRRLGRPASSVPLIAGWSAQRIARVAGGRVVRDRHTCVHALSTDTRALTRGALFVALRGERFDAHRFLAAAVDAGASTLVVDDASAAEGLDASVIVVDDTTSALGRIGAGVLDEARRRREGLRTVAITGSNGKTTTKELLAALIGADGQALVATPGNLNNHIGLPLTIAAVAPSTRDAVLELGANRPDDIRELAEIARPDVAVITSIGRAHLEGLGGIDGVRRTKGGIFAFGPRVAVLPAHEATQPVMSAMIGAETFVATFGGSSATLCVIRRSDTADVELRGSGPLDGWHVRVPLSLPGEHNAMNLAAALLAAVARTGDLTADRMPDAGTIARALASVELPAGRLRRIELAGRTIIDDAYNANPESMLASLDLLSRADGARIAVLGDMLELGPDAEAMHAEVGRHAAALADLVIGVGPLARHLCEAAGGPWASDLDVAAEWVAGAAAPGATILLKGSRGGRLERLIDGLRLRWEVD